MVGIDQDPLGVKPVDGFCGRRAIRVDPSGNSVYGTRANPDIAYRVDSTAVLSIQTASAFPMGFPRDFSILLTFRTVDNIRSNLLTIYSSSGLEQFSLRIGNNVSVNWINSTSERAPRFASVTFSGQRVNDGNWHRLALSAKGDSLTLLTDCAGQQTRSFNRALDSDIDRSGITLVGQTILDSSTFEGDLQQLFVIPSPSTAYEQCLDFIPDCETPFPDVDDEITDVDDDLFTGEGSGVITEVAGGRGDVEITDEEVIDEPVIVERKPEVLVTTDNEVYVPVVTDRVFIPERRVIPEEQPTVDRPVIVDMPLIPPYILTNATSSTLPPATTVYITEPGLEVTTEPPQPNTVEPAYYGYNYSCGHCYPGPAGFPGPAGHPGMKGDRGEPGKDGVSSRELNGSINDGNRITNSV